MPRSLPIKPIDTESPTRLNVGCGRRFHQDWINLDLCPSSPDVVDHDITKGLPFDESEIDTVYHSHVLEHLSPDQGKELVTECFRVLKPGGVLRIVVPDLEEICQLYLAMHDEAWNGNQRAAVNYHWMKMELLDQMVRIQSGGLMGPYMSRIAEEDSHFVESRLGNEFSLCRSPDVDVVDAEEDNKSSLGQRIADQWLTFRVNLSKWLVRRLMGKEASRSFENSLFRAQGEIHRWMYDRYSLKELCERAGFTDFKVATAFESRIEEFGKFELDSEGEKICKPDSLFIECVKPAHAVAKKIAA